MAVITESSPAVRYGIELDAYRAEAASKVLDHVIQGDALSAQKSIETTVDELRGLTNLRIPGHVNNRSRVAMLPESPASVRTVGYTGGNPPGRVVAMSDPGFARSNILSDRSFIKANVCVTVSIHP